MITETNTSEGTERPQITFKAEFISAPANYLPGDGNGIMTEPQLRQIIESLEKIPGGRVMQGQVTTLADRQTQIIVPFAGLETGNAASFNVALDLLATCKTNSPEIHLESAYGTIGYFAGNPTYGRDQRNLFALTNSLTIWDGQTVVVTRRLPTEWVASKLGRSQEESSLVTLVTATLIDAAGNRLSTGESIVTNAQSTAGSRIISVAPDGSPSLLQLPSVVEPSPSGVSPGAFPSATKPGD